MGVRSSAHSRAQVVAQLGVDELQSELDEGEPGQWASSSRPERRERRHRHHHNHRSGASGPRRIPSSHRVSRSAGTPSTATPPSMSRGTSSVASTPFDDDNGSQASSERYVASPEQRLRQARQRARDLSEALNLQLKGFGGALGVRYTAWKEGTTVNVSGEEGRLLQAQFVCYNADAGSIEIRLADGSRRTVPANQVTRAVAEKASASVPSPVPQLRPSGL
mmetsp:Transcript_68608/g.127964  ORF Transcript_68608/g.127964 Transcript_68608/m.127964 type:complete len:221 (-) Transcript_68608:120-782(-)